MPFPVLATIQIKVQLQGLFSCSYVSNIWPCHSSIAFNLPFSVGYQRACHNHTRGEHYLDTKNNVSVNQECYNLQLESVENSWSFITVLPDS